MEMPNLVTAVLSSVLFLSLLYHLKLSYPRDHNVRMPVHAAGGPGHGPAQMHDADFMRQAGHRMLQVDLWEQQLAWQRLQTDLILRAGRKGRVPDRISPEAMKVAIAALHAANQGDQSGFSLQDLYMREDVDIAANKQQRAQHERSIEERLVDRMHAAFSLAPDTPQAYNGVQVPFTLEEFRDYIIGFSQDSHRRFKRDQVLDSIRGRRRPSTAAPLPPTSSLPVPSEDYIVWATRKYLQHSRPFKLQDGETEAELPEGVDAECISPDTFKMYSPNTFTTLGGQIEQGKAGQGKGGQDKGEQDRGGQGKGGQSKAEQDKGGQGKGGQSKECST